MAYRRKKKGAFRKAFVRIARKEARAFGKIAWREFEGFINVLLGMRRPRRRR